MLGTVHPSRFSEFFFPFRGSFFKILPLDVHFSSNISERGFYFSTGITASINIAALLLPCVFDVIKCRGRVHMDNKVFPS